SCGAPTAAASSCSAWSSARSWPSTGTRPCSRSQAASRCPAVRPASSPCRSDGARHDLRPTRPRGGTVTTATYLRPVGRLPQTRGRGTALPDKVVRISEREDVCFTALELIQRHGDGWADRRLISIDEARALVSHGG